MVTLSFGAKQEFKHRDTTLFSLGQSWEESKKELRGRGRGRRRGEKETLASEPHNSEKCICPQMQLVIGVVLVSQSRYVLFMCIIDK